jgi:AraC-like DNA-binding protein/ligand-binding sensor protein
MCFHHGRTLLRPDCVRSPSLVQESPSVALRSSLPAVIHSDVKISEPGTISEKLSQSHILRDYERAFSEATGLPLAFAPAGKKRPGMRGSVAANEFCTHMAENEPGCRMCVDMQEKLAATGAGGTTQSAACIAGLTDSAVPVRIGDKVLGFLQTGQVALKKLTPANFCRVSDFLKKGGADVDWETLERAYFDTRVIGRKQYDAVLRLLEVFAQHLALAAEQIATQQTHAEPPMVEQARQVIEERSGETLTLTDIARSVHVSTFHFCKIFKHATGMTFTQYLAMVRIAKAKKLLANPQARISEVAYQAGFASLTHFNRMFRRIAGQSPTDFRRQVCGLH